VRLLERVGARALDADGRADAGPIAWWLWLFRRDADGRAMRAPFGSRFARLYAVVAVACAFIALYRAGLYGLPAGAWVVLLAVAVFGLAAPLALGSSVRSRMLTGKAPLALVIPVVALVLSPRLVPSPLTVGPLLFCAGALVGACAVACVNARHRRRRSLDGGAESFVTAYFELGTSVQTAADWRALRRALWTQAWLSTPANRAHAATRLRHTAAAIERRDRMPVPAELPVLGQLAEPCEATAKRIHAALLAAAVKLENGGRIVRWRRWLWSLVAPGVDAERDWIAAVDVLARRYGLTPPTWFRAYRSALARAPLTPADVAPTRSIRPALAGRVTAGIFVLVVASVLLSTATAQTPLDDARALPVMTGSRAASHVEPRFSAVVSDLAGRRAEARCWSEADWRRLSRQRSTWPRRARRLGPWSAYASPANDEAQFSPTLCAVLSRVVYEHIPVWDDEWPAADAFAVATLAHEAQHLHGILNEAKAECYGMQAITRTAQLLGRTRTEGRYLARLYWHREYHDEDRDPAYFSTECRDGGELDLRPATPEWP